MPVTLNEPPASVTSYQHDTAAKAMCGSLATSGLPVVDRDPAMTQLLLPTPSSGSPTAAPTGCVPTGAAGYDPGGRMLSSSASPSRNAR